MTVLLRGADLDFFNAKVGRWHIAVAPVAKMPSLKLPYAKGRAGRPMVFHSEPLK